MLRLPEIGPGAVIGVGRTNFRVAQFEASGEISGAPFIIDTPHTAKEFFAIAARSILDAAHGGAGWAVLGVPGPVSVVIDKSDNVSQKLKATNIPALNQPQGIDPVAEMIAADPAFQELGELSSFHFLTVNDGDLAAQAGAKLFATEKHNVVADIIDGSGAGGSVVERDKDYEGQNLFHPVTGAWEVGHLPDSLESPRSTPEEKISGKAFDGKFDKKLRDLDSDNPVFESIARGIADIAIVLGMTASPDLIVISGGIGIETQDKYKGHLEQALKSFAASGNPMGRLATRAEIKFPDMGMANEYELHGAPGAIRSHLALRALSDLKRHLPLNFAYGVPFTDTRN